MSDVVVLGAGPAGLMAALTAARAGHQVTVLEASSQVGGMAGSFEVAGQRVDFGSHRLHPATPPALLGLIRELLGEDLQSRPRAGRIRLGGRWVGFPLRAANLVSSLPPTMAGRLMADAAAGTVGRVIKRGAGAVEGASFATEILHRFGPTVLAEFYGPFATKLYGVDPADLSGELARRRVSASSPGDIAKRLARAARPAGRTFYYPRRGYGQIAERLADAAIDAGATIALNSPVDGVQVGADCVTISAGTSSVEAPVGLSTIPVTTLGAIMDPGPSADVVAALDAVETRAMILVYLVLDRPQYTPFDAHYLPGLDTTVARLSEPKNYRTADDPPGTTVLCAEIACWTTDDMWQWPADRLAELVVSDLERSGLPTVHHVGCEVKRLGSVYPVYRRATESDRAMIDRWASSNDRLLSLGRQGLRAIDNLHHVLAMGEGAASSIAHDGAVDMRHWRNQLTQFAKHTVED